MKNENLKLTPTNRIVVMLASLLMIGAYFTTVWYIDLEAPQYPEGLGLQIWVNGLKGDVESINNLNHYIGMATLHNENFIEFKILPYVLAVMILGGLFVAWKNNRKWLFGYLVFLVVIAIIASIDFYRWEYDYGHNLDPKAAIRIPGMAYQPPFIGYKELLNFLAGSFPDVGGWLIIGGGLSMAWVYFRERFVLPRKKQQA